jgi:hypothetical protein
MGKFQSGQNKPPGSGRKRGTPNKKSLNLGVALDAVDYRVTKATGITYRLVHKLFEKNLTKPYSRLEVAGILYDRKLELQSDTHRAIQQEFECTQYAQQPSTRWAHGEDVYDCEVVRDRANGDVFSLDGSDELQGVFRKSVRPGH